MQLSTHAVVRIGCIFALVCCVHAAPARAQLFGARTVGQPISSAANRPGGLGAPSPGTAGSAAGLLDGSERFVRGNRSRRDFVGSDRNEQSSFVGASQAIGVGRVQSATEGLRVDSSNVQRLNRPLPQQPSKGVYYPRLEVGFEKVVPKEMSGAVEQETSDRRLHARIADVAGSKTQLILSGRTAILRGSVPSSHTSELAVHLLRFEPGIDRVQNELRVE